MDAAGVREGAGIVDVAGVVDAVDVLSGIQAVDRTAGDGREARGALGRFFQRRLERLVLPPRLPAFGNRFHTTSIIPTAAEREDAPSTGTQIAGHGAPRTCSDEFLTKRARQEIAVLSHSRSFDAAGVGNGRAGATRVTGAPTRRRKDPREPMCSPG